MKIKITYIISNIHKALAFEWVAQELDRNKFELSFILLNPGPSLLEDELIKLNIPVKRIKYRGKKDMPIAFFKLFNWLFIHRPKIVHAHLFDACLLAMPAAFFAGIKKRIHTRHSSVYHHDEHPKMVKYDRLINFFSTHIIAISKVVSDVLITMEKVKPRKVKLIPHGFKLEDFEDIEKPRIDTLKMKYQCQGYNPVIGVISRYIGWKGIQYIIPAFEKLLTQFPNALLILANANGDNRFKIHQQLANIPPDNFIEIAFEEDLFALYKLFDVFIHVPNSMNSEAFGQTYIEALAVGIPSVFTLSGIANEFIKDHENALVVPYRDTNAIFDSCKELLDNKLLAAKISETGQQHVKARFQLNKMITSLENLYAQ